LTYVVGTTLDADMPTTSDALFPTFGDHSAAFYLAVFSQNALVYATYFGGLDTTGGLANFSLGFITVAPNPTGGTVYLAGGTSATNFPVTAGAYQTTNHGGLYGEDAWAAKLTIPALAGH